MQDLIERILSLDPERGGLVLSPEDTRRLQVFVMRLPREARGKAAATETAWALGADTITVEPGKAIIGGVARDLPVATPTERTYAYRSPYPLFMTPDDVPIDDLLRAVQALRRAWREERGGFSVRVMGLVGGVVSATEATIDFSEGGGP